MLVKAAGMLLEQQRSSMSATALPDATAASSEFGLPPSCSAFRLGHESGDAAGEWRVEWKFGRNCSLAPRQLLGFYSVLCVLSLAVAAFFWWFGAPMRMRFELSGQGRRVWLGRYLRRELRRQLANELRMALRHPAPIRRGADR